MLVANLLVGEECKIRPKKPIYFSKIEFRECAERRENLIFLDLVQRELSLEYYHEDEYMWPHEKLYLCLRKNFIAEIRGCSRQRKKNQGGY